MRIVQIAPLYEAVPPRFYAGTERIVAHLNYALVGLARCRYQGRCLGQSGEGRLSAKG